MSFLTFPCLFGLGFGKRSDFCSQDVGYFLQSLALWGPNSFLFAARVCFLFMESLINSLSLIHLHLCGSYPVLISHPIFNTSPGFRYPTTTTTLSQILFSIPNSVGSKHKWPNNNIPLLLLVLQLLLLGSPTTLIICEFYTKFSCQLFYFHTWTQYLLPSSFSSTHHHNIQLSLGTAFIATVAVLAGERV